MKQTYPTNSVVIIRTSSNSRTKTAAVILGFDPDKQTTHWGMDPTTGVWGKSKISAPYHIQPLKGRHFKSRRNIPEDWIEAYVSEIDPSSHLFAMLDKHYLAPADWDKMCNNAIEAAKNNWQCRTAGDDKKFLHLGKLARFEPVTVLDNGVENEYEIYEIHLAYTNHFKVRKPNGAVKAFPISSLVI